MEDAVSYQVRYIAGFRVMPFGLAGAHTTFQRLTQSVSFEELDDLADEVLAFSSSRGEHLRHLRHVFG